MNIIFQQYQKCNQSANTVNELLDRPGINGDDVNTLNRELGFLRSWYNKLQQEGVDMGFIDSTINRCNS